MNALHLAKPQESARNAWIGLGAPRHTLALLDSIAAAAALVVSSFWALRGATHEELPRISHIIALTVLGLLLLLLLYRDGQYSARRRLSRIEDSTSVLKNLVLAYLLTIGVMFATKGFFTGYGSLSRMVLLVELGSLFTLMLGARWGMWAYERSRLMRGEGLTRTVIIGEGTPAVDFARFLGMRPWLGVTCAGRLSLSEDAYAPGGKDRPAGEEVWRDIPCVGTVDDVTEALSTCRATQVIVALDATELGHLPRVTRLLTQAGVPYRFLPSLFEHTYHAAKLAGFAELPMVYVELDPLDRVQQTLKRALDLSVAVCLLALSTPAWLAAVIAVKVSSPGPVFFRQERVGRNGRHFQMLKLRTMYREAEAGLSDVLQHNEAHGPIFKMRADPRVTPVGHLLRRWSLDELPQVVNVLRGEMSMVGPRPPLPGEVQDYETEHLCRLKGTPGITGLWQVSGRSELTFEQMVKLDRFYLENWSLGLDLKILLRTAYVVLTHRGAY